MASIYLEGDYLANNPSWHQEDSAIKARWIDEILRRQSLEPKTIVEVGCGAGGVLAELQRRRPAAAYTGYEISPDAFTLCAPRAAENLAYHNVDILKSDARGFDCLLLIDVFEHVPDYMGFIEALRDRAEYKIFHIPLDMSVQSLLRGHRFLEVRQSIGHLHYFFKDTALATVRDCGYEIVDFMYTAGTQELPGQSLGTKLMNVPRKALQLVSEDIAARMLGGYSLLVLAR